MSDSDNAQLPIDTPQEEEKGTPQETPEEGAEETVIPSAKAKANRKPKEPNELKTRVRKLFS